MGCAVDIANYPFDFQKCRVLLNSFSNSIESVQYVWAIAPQMDNDIIPMEQTIAVSLQSVFLCFR